MRAFVLLALPVTYGACAMDTEHVSTETSASHAWSDYHWARTVDGFAIPTIDSMTPEWEPFLATAVADWSSSQRLDMALEAGDDGAKTRRRCSPPDGKIRVCNLGYGQTGWLGVAGITIDAAHHILRGYTKINDTYFAWDYYNTALWKQSVTCQELGHDLGLDHQDENFDNGSLFSCMDYQDPPYSSPNAHDYEELDLIYGHVDSYDTYATGEGGGSTCNAPPGKGCNNASDIAATAGWGVSVGRHGHSEVFSRTNLDGTVDITHVLWVEPQ